MLQELIWGKREKEKSSGNNPNGKKPGKTPGYASSEKLKPANIHGFMSGAAAWSLEVLDFFKT